MLDEIFKSLNSYNLESQSFLHSDVLIEFLNKIDLVPYRERTPIVDAITNKAMEILCFGNKEKIIDLNYLVNLLKILSRQNFFNVTVAEHIFNTINQNLSQVYFRPTHYIPLVIKYLCELQFKNKDTYKNESFISIINSLASKSNFKYYDDYSFVIMLLCVTYMKDFKNLKTSSEIKFILEYTISKDRKTYKFLQFGKNLLKFNRNVLKQMFVTITTFDESISPITFK